jgi:hypothetical protein
MAAPPRSALTRRTAVWAAAPRAAAARRTGVGTRASHRTGQLWRAGGTGGAWRAATTTGAPRAAPVPPVATPVPLAPAALAPRRPQRAHALRPARSPPALATTQALAAGGAEGFGAALPPVSRAARTGVARPDRLNAPGPGSGGRAAAAGATMQAGGDDPRRRWAPGALTAGHRPDQASGDHGVAGAPPGAGWLWAGGECQRPAGAPRATAGASGLRRLTPQPRRVTPGDGPGHPLVLAHGRTTGDGPLRAPPICLGAKARVAARRSRARGPAAIVTARRRLARQNAPPQGDPPSHAPRPRLAGHLLMPHGPAPLGPTAPGRTVAPRRWPSARRWPSGTRARPWASLTPTPDAPTCGAREGRMRRRGRHAARCPPRRARRGTPRPRALPLRPRMRPFPAWAAPWRQASWQAARVWRRGLRQPWPTAPRGAATAVRQHRTPPHRLPEQCWPHHPSLACAEALHASLKAYAPHPAPFPG